MSTYLIEPYKKYYDKLSATPSLLTDANSLCDSVTKLSNNTTRLKSQIEFASWKELGCEEITTNVIPNIQTKVNLINSKISQSLKMICNKSVNELLPKLKELKKIDEDYEELNKKFSNLKEPKKKYTDSSMSEKTDEYKNYEKNKAELTNSMSSLDSKAKVLREDIDSIVNEIKGVKEEKNDTMEEVNIDNTEELDNLNLTDIERKKIKFIGNVDTDEYTISPSAGKKAQTLRLFYNGKELSNKDEIVVKKGETVRITVKLPTTAGKIKQLTRTNADGAEDWEKYASGYSEPFVNRYDPNTFLHTNTYDWVITANKTGSTVISQTAEMSTDTFQSIKSMVVLNLKVIKDQ